MPYIRLSDAAYPISEREIRDAHTNTSFGQPFNPDGYAVVFFAPQPAYDQATQSVREASPVLTALGHWEQTWEVNALDAATIAVNLHAAKAERKLAIKSALNELLIASNTYNTAEGWVLDARRTDLDNLKNYLHLQQSVMATNADVRLHDNTMVSMPITRLESLVTELIAAGLAMYQHKWELEASIDACTNVTDVREVIW